MNKNTLIHDLAMLILAVGIISVAVVIYQFYPLAQKYLDYKARFDCAQSSSVVYQDQATSTTVTNPVNDLYQKCLTEKGL